MEVYDPIAILGLWDHMGGCQNYGPFLGPLDTRCRIILRTQEGIIVLTTTHMILPSIGSGPYGALLGSLLGGAQELGSS